MTSMLNTFCEINEDVNQAVKSSFGQWKEFAFSYTQPNISNYDESALNEKFRNLLKFKKETSRLIKFWDLR